jgi:hypothetical protein
LAGHLTKGDVHFLASVGSDAHRKLDDLAAAELDALAEAHDLDVELPALEALDADDADLDNPELIDAARAELQSVMGSIGRGEDLTDLPPSGRVRQGGVGAGRTRRTGRRRVSARPQRVDGPGATDGPTAALLRNRDCYFAAGIASVG